MGIPVDRNHLDVDPDIEPEPVEELLGGLEGEIVLFFDQAADEVGQAAISEGDMAGALDHRDLHVGIEPAQTGCCGHTARDTSDNDDSLDPAIGGTAHRENRDLRLAVGVGGRRHWHRRSACASPNTRSMWAPHPFHEGLLHLLHVTARHMPSSSSSQLHEHALDLFDCVAVRLCLFGVLEAIHQP